MDGSPAPLITAPIAAGGADVFTFTVTAPAGALAGTYVHIIEVVSMSDSTSRESLAARSSSWDNRESTW